MKDNQIQTIFIEDLHIKGMECKHNLVQSINDVSIGKFYELLTYKSQWQGINLLKIGHELSKLTLGEIVRVNDCYVNDLKSILSLNQDATMLLT